MSLNEAARKLVKYIREYEVKDDFAYDGNGSVDTWMSSDFEALIEAVEAELEEAVND